MSLKNRKRRLIFVRKWKELESLGFIMECSGECPHCGKHQIFLINRYDALACMACNRWLEKACSDPKCPFCANRPESPAGALFFLKDDIQRRIQLLRKDNLRKNYQRKHYGEIRRRKKIINHFRRGYHGKFTGYIE